MRAACPTPGHPWRPGVRAACAQSVTEVHAPSRNGTDPRDSHAGVSRRCAGGVPVIRPSTSDTCGRPPGRRCRQATAGTYVARGRGSSIGKFEPKKPAINGRATRGTTSAGAVRSDGLRHTAFFRAHAGHLASKRPPGNRGRPSLSRSATGRPVALAVLPRGGGGPARAAAAAALLRSAVLRSGGAVGGGLGRAGVAARRPRGARRALGAADARALLAARSAELARRLVQHVQADVARRAGAGGRARRACPA